MQVDTWPIVSFNTTGRRQIKCRIFSFKHVYQEKPSEFINITDCYVNKSLT